MRKGKQPRHTDHEGRNHFSAKAKTVPMRESKYVKIKRERYSPLNGPSTRIVYFFISPVSRKLTFFLPRQAMRADPLRVESMVRTNGRVLRAHLRHGLSRSLESTGACVIRIRAQTFGVAKANKDVLAWRDDRECTHIHRTTLVHA